jgi:glycosyltransferase involved in cell wall biosynthesis
MTVSISVVTAVYNRRDTIAQALDSVLAQTHADVRSVVVDGASTDGTLDVLRSYDGRLRCCVSERDAGLYDALNKGLSLADGDVVGFLHADDVYAGNDVLERVARVFEDPAVDAVYGDLVYVRHDDVARVVRHWRAGNFSRAALRRGWMPPHPTFYARRSVYARHGGFDTAYRIAADYDAMLRYLAPGTLRLHYLPQVLVRMRLGGASNRSLANIVTKSREDLHALRRNGVGGLGTLLCKNLRKLPQFLSSPPPST